MTRRELILEARRLGYVVEPATNGASPLPPCQRRHGHRGEHAQQLARHQQHPGRAAACAVPAGHHCEDITMSNNKVLLTTLSVRTSSKGRPYLAGWLGKASVVAFAGEPDKFGNPTWDLFLAGPEPLQPAR